MVYGEGSINDLFPFAIHQCIQHGLAVLSPGIPASADDGSGEECFTIKPNALHVTPPEIKAYQRLSMCSDGPKPPSFSQRFPLLSAPSFPSPLPTYLLSPTSILESQPSVGKIFGVQPICH